MKFYLGKRYKEFIYSPKGYIFHVTSDISQFLNEEFIEKELSEVHEILYMNVMDHECKLLFTLNSDYIITYPSGDKWQHLESMDMTKHPILDTVDLKNINICPACVKITSDGSEYCTSCGDRIMNLGHQEEWNGRYANCYWLGGERVYGVINKSY